MVAFVARIAWTGIVYPTYLGGPDNDSGLAMAVDSMTSITVVGQTGSPDFPVAGGLENQGAGIAGVGKGQIVRSRDVLNQNLVANRADTEEYRACPRVRRPTTSLLTTGTNHC